MTETQQLQPGTRLAEYRIESKLGQGGFGVTYAAFDTHLEKAVAIKEYLPSDWAIRVDAETVGPRSVNHREDYAWGLERFLDEARALARFEHPGINRVHRFFEAHGTAYMVLEYVRGESLGALLQRERVLSAERITGLLDELAAALVEVHRAGYVHRDIKPDNILLREDGRAVLVDFGAARQAIGGRSRSVTSILTPGYAPVEQYDTQATDIGPWTDIYALGMVAYRCVTGVSGNDLVEAPTRARKVFSGDTDPLEPARKLAGPGYPESLLEAIDAAIRINENERPADAAALRARLDTKATGGDTGAGTGEGTEAPVTVGADQRRTLRINHELARKGGKARLRIPDLRLCEACAGSGVVLPRERRCHACAGSGSIHVREDKEAARRECPVCRGEAAKDAPACATCSGRGLTEGEREVEIRIPAGLEAGQRMRFRDLGAPDPGGGERGALLVKFQFREGAKNNATDEEGREAAAGEPGPARADAAAARPAAGGGAGQASDGNRRPHAPTGLSPLGYIARGNAGLAATYWLLAVVGGIVFTSIATAVWESRITYGERVGIYAAVNALYIAYMLPVLIGVWNAAGRYTGRAVWVGLARTVVVLGVLSLPLVGVDTYDRVQQAGLIEHHAVDLLLALASVLLALGVLNAAIGEGAHAIRHGRYRDSGFISSVLVLLPMAGLLIWQVVERIESF